MGSFKIIESNTKAAKFLVEDVDLSIVNSVRRIILSEIPNAAFEFDPYNEKNGITISVNTTSLHNEFLAHRISLVPLCFDEDEIESFDPSKYRFVLKKKNDSSEMVSVTTKDFEIYDENNVKYDTKFRNKIFPANDITKDHILLTKLKPNPYDLSKGEEVDIECFASINVAKEHARWSPVSKCAFFNVVDEESAKRAEAEVPSHLKNKFQYLDKQRYYKKNAYDEPCLFEFHIDSECKLTPKYLFGKALDILKTQVNHFVDNLDTLEINEVNGMHSLSLMGYTHTLLNVLQSMIYNSNFRVKKPSENPLEFIGYHQSHPLDNKMVLKIKFKDASSSVHEFIRKECTVITNYINDLEEKWKAM